MPYNTNLSRSRGRGFEDQIVRRLHSLGYVKAKKNVLSGSTLKKPYDIKVPPFRLKIEAKRTMKNYITILSKWMDRITDLYVVVFAIGRYAGKKQIDMHAISKCQERPFGETHVPIIEMRKAKRIKLSDIMGEALICYEDEYYYIQSFENLMQTKFPIRVDKHLPWGDHDGE